jgi:hypothetical protein
MVVDEPERDVLGLQADANPGRGLVQPRSPMTDCVRVGHHRVEVGRATDVGERDRRRPDARSERQPAVRETAKSLRQQRPCIGLGQSADVDTCDRDTRQDPLDERLVVRGNAAGDERDPERRRDDEGDELASGARDPDQASSIQRVL